MNLGIVFSSLLWWLRLISPTGYELPDFQTSIPLAPHLGHSVSVSASGRFPRAEGQGGTVKGAVGFLAQWSLFNLTGMIFAFLAESLPKACNRHHLTI